MKKLWFVIIGYSLLFYPQFVAAIAEGEITSKGILFPIFIFGGIWGMGIIDFFIFIHDKLNDRQ